jgi:hypothetical protein
MAIKTKWWFFQSSRDSLVRFTREGNFDVLVKNFLGGIGVISTSRTSWYDNGSLIGAEGNLGEVVFPLITIFAQREQQISDALKRHLSNLEGFGHRYEMLRPDEGTLYVVLVDSERKASQLSMTMAFGFTLGQLTPDFEGVEMDTIFTDGFSLSAPPQPTIRRVSRYERKWVI